jgi:3-oxoacyl-[acyl-carrier protein] reductase
MELSGKHAIVCGSSQGIGFSTAKLMAERGAKITLVGRNEIKMIAAMRSLKQIDGIEHDFIIADFSQPNQLKEAVANYLSKGNQPTILVNNTGGPKGGLIIDADISEFTATFNQHLVCNHIMVQALFPVMKSLGEGSIINVISTSVKQPLNGLGVSNTIRGAVANWSKTMANELGQFNIRVNNVLPGATGTGRLQEIAEAKSEKSAQNVAEIFEEMAKQSPMQRIAKPEEIAEAIAFLASPRASYINGINIPVDGGRTKSL